MSAGRTTEVDAARYIGTNTHKQSQPSQQKPASSLQSRTRCTVGRGCEAWAAICCDCNLWKLWKQYTAKFSVFRKKDQDQKLFCNNDFRTVIIYNSIPDALRDFHASECKRLHNRTYDGCLWKPTKNATKFARANNSNLLRALKHLIETRL